MPNRSLQKLGLSQESATLDPLRASCPLLNPKGDTDKLKIIIS